MATEGVLERHTDALTEYRQARAELVRMVEAELDDDARRPAAKQQAIQRIMQGTNPLTGKPHSASSAEAIVETDAEYAAWLANHRAIIVAKMHAQTRAELALESAKMLRASALEAVA